jgi:hypothetical protein
VDLRASSSSLSSASHRRSTQGPRRSPRARTCPNALRLGGHHHRGCRRVLGDRRRQRALLLLPAPLLPLLPEPQMCASHPAFTRQAANLWKAKERLWQELLAETPHDPTFALADSFLLPACSFARAYRCRRFRGEAAFGKDILLKSRPSTASGCT